MSGQFAASFEGMKCEEASQFSVTEYIPCGQPATAVVWHQRDGKHTYLMCAACADHNVRNRGGKLVAIVLKGDAWPDKLVREYWRRIGGRFYGPNVEHGTMEESKLLPALRHLLCAAGKQPH